MWLFWEACLPSIHVFLIDMQVWRAAHTTLSLSQLLQPREMGKKEQKINRSETSRERHREG